MLRALFLAIVALVALAAVALWHFRPSDTRITALPRQLAAAVPGVLPSPPAHVVIVVEENKEFSDIVGKRAKAPYLNELIDRFALFTKSYGVAHPSQPNYLALFAGVTNDNGDGCPPSEITTTEPNLGQELLQAHLSFAGYAEDLPQPGYRGCWHGQYARKHVPWADFSNVPDDALQPFSALPAYDKLPAVSFIIPNLLNDMHSASIERGDAWLRKNVGPLVDWSMQNNSLVVVTWDESDDAVDNHIPTIFAGPMVRQGRFSEPVTHYSVLRTIEQLYRLPYSGRAAQAAPITGIWKTPLSKAGT